MNRAGAEHVREEAFRAASAAVDRFLERVGSRSGEEAAEPGPADWGRLRSELGRVVDLNLEMVRKAFGLYGGLIGPETWQSGDKGWLLLGPVLSGAEASTVMWLHNFDDDPVEMVGFVGSTLASASGLRIEKPLWSFLPGAVSVPPRSAVPVTVGLAVPTDTQTGSYHGSIATEGREGQAVDIRVEVLGTHPVPHDSW
jgi:hypothetical protein